MRRLLLVLGLAFASLGAAGCNEFHYYDVYVRYGSTFDPNVISQVQTCLVQVSGADTKEFLVEGKCTNGTPTREIGVFEFSTFADSGTLNFRITTYIGNQFAECVYGTGMKSIMASSATTTADDPASMADDLVIDTAGPNGCQN
jgi:hypothetical protein